MALQLGSLRDALLEAKVSPDLASKASEEVAAFENSIAKLTTLVQVIIAITTALLISQFALWTKVGENTAQIASINGQIVSINGQLTSMNGQLTSISGQLARLAH